jgi:hypothetical protein
MFTQPEPTPIIGEYHREQLAILANMTRLRQQRREREAAIIS